MPTVTVDVDVDLDDIYDDELIEEFVRRVRKNQSFRKEIMDEWKDEMNEVFDVLIKETFPDQVPPTERALEYFQLRDYQEALIHLERALGKEWLGLSDLRVTK
jgi:hypothetical protein